MRSAARRPREKMEKSTACNRDCTLMAMSCYMHCNMRLVFVELGGKVLWLDIFKVRFDGETLLLYHENLGIEERFTKFETVVICMLNFLIMIIFASSPFLTVFV
jgi:hypothetical protein